MEIRLVKVYFNRMTESGAKAGAEGLGVALVHVFDALISST